MRSIVNLLSVEDAESVILGHTFQPGTERIALSDSSGRVNATHWRADADLPPFDRVTMDGIAIRYSDYESGTREFHCVTVQRAGDEAFHLTEAATCIEIMTGAICPVGADTVIPYELLQKTSQGFQVGEIEFRRGWNIHTKGSDKKKGDVLVEAGSRLSFPEVGVAASIGLAEPEVYRLPRIALISTGDELVAVDQKPLGHQIRRSNIYALQAFFKSWGMSVTMLHLPDEEASIKKGLSQLLEDKDLIVLSGGVSMGKFDLIPDMLTGLGVKCHFHRIAQRPGKPLWFGTRDKCTVFALPGNPVSSLLCTVRYIDPWLRKCYGLPPQRLRCVLSASVSYKPGLEFFVPVHITLGENGSLNATPCALNGSGDYAGLTAADGFLQLPASGQAEVLQSYPYWPLRSLG